MNKRYHSCDQGDRLADLLGLSDEWLDIDDLCGKAAEHITELEAENKRLRELKAICVRCQRNAVIDIGYSG